MANTGRENLLEEVGRIDAEKSNPNRRAEKKRVVGELNKGYKTGGRVGLKYGSKPASSKNTSAGVVLAGKKVGCQIV